MLRALLTLEFTIIIQSTLLKIEKKCVLQYGRFNKFIVLGYIKYDSLCLLNGLGL